MSLKLPSLSFLNSRKFFAWCTPVWVFVLGFISELFAAASSSVWFWTLSLAFYSYLFVDRWHRVVVRRLQEQTTKSFRWDLLPSNLHVNGNISLVVIGSLQQFLPTIFSSVLLL